MTDDLVTWFRAQLDDEERVARAATPGPWSVGEQSDQTYGDWWPVRGWALYADVAASGYEGGGITSAEDAEHIARQDPAATLARIEVHRQIVGHLAATAAKCPPDDWPDTGGMELAALADQARHLLRLLALAYADRPGYRAEEWAP